MGDEPQTGERRERGDVESSSQTRAFGAPDITFHTGLKSHVCLEREATHNKKLHF